MNRRSFFKVAAGVLAGALGAGWLWSRKPEQITFKGVPITYSPCLDDPICEVLRNHFSKRIWSPYTVRVWYDRVDFVVNIGDGDWDHGAIYRFCLHRDEIGPGGANLMDRRFDDSFSRLREIVAKGSLETGVQA